MSAEGQGGRPAFSQKTAEVVVAAAIFVAGAVVVYDSLRLGAKWADDGPQSGYLPFYIGVLICISALANLVSALLVRPEKGKAFVEVGQLRLVLSVLIPTAVYVGFISWLGIYVASAVFIAFFMRWLGKYGWLMLSGVAVGNSVFFYVVFEVWFKIPLPKGPLESLVGLG